MDFQAITAVPVHMCRLQNLKTLSISNNPLLESLPGALGHLPSLKSLRLISNPSLRTPPNEIVSRGFASIKAYLKRLAGGFTECRRTKLMLVGLGGAGKTSLLKAVMSPNKKTAGTSGEDITNGIDIMPWTVKTNNDIEVTYNTWDFAGQTLYYNTHQFFLSKRAVYLLLWSTRQGYEHAGLEFWLSSIASHAPKTPIFVVGTHCDQVPKADIPMDDLQQKYPQIAGFHFVSSVQGIGIAKLEEDLIQVTLEQKNMGEKVPKVWLNMEKKILAFRSTRSTLPWNTIKEIGMEDWYI
uniref:Roc domain-containing protein n=1 Tax=Biomphalaria glabrata TaxID=6526 RepID=A0A2C9LJS2_BIOGL